MEENDGKLLILQRLRERNFREKGQISAEAFLTMKDQVVAQFEKREANMRLHFEQQLELARGGEGEKGKCEGKSDDLNQKMREEINSLREELSAAYQQSYKETTEVVQTLSHLEKEQDRSKDLEQEIDGLKDEKKDLEEVVKIKEVEWMEKMETITAMKKEMDTLQGVIHRLEKKLQSAQTEKENAEISTWSLERKINAQKENEEKVTKEIAIERRTMEFEKKRWSELTNKLMEKLGEQQHSLHDLATQTNTLKARLDKVTNKVLFLDQSIFSVREPEHLTLSSDDFKDIGGEAVSEAALVSSMPEIQPTEKNVVSRFFSSIFSAAENETEQDDPNKDNESPKQRAGGPKKKRSASDFSSFSSSSSSSTSPEIPLSSSHSSRSPHISSSSSSPFSSSSSSSPSPSPSLSSSQDKNDFSLPNSPIKPPYSRCASSGSSPRTRHGEIDTSSGRFGDSLVLFQQPTFLNSSISAVAGFSRSAVRRPTILSGHTEPVTCVKMCESGHVMVTGASDNLVKVWDVMTGREVRSLQGATRSVLCVDVSICGRYALGGRKDNAISVWDIKNSRHIDTLTGHTRPVIGAAFDHQSNIISTAQDRTLKLWKNTRQGVFQISESLSFLSIPTDLCVSLTSCYISHLDHKIREFNMVIGKEADTIDIHSATVCSVVVDGNTLASNSRSHDLKLCDLRTHDVTCALRDHRYRVGRDTCRFAMGLNMIWAGSETGQILEWDLRKKEVVRVLEYPLKGGGVSGVGAVHGSGQQLVSYYHNRSDCVGWG